ncbi:MAG: Ig-like domain-containing protein [Verrucomicrobiota bacterium]|jgi:hypothetical protein
MTQKTTIKLLGFLASAALALSLAHTASAQTDWHWAGLDAGGVWSDPNNWLPEAGTTTFPPSVPPPAVSGQIVNVWLDAANGSSVITITNGDVETPGIPPPGSPEVYNTIFGPEWGVTLNIYGSLTYDWMLFPVQNNPTPGLRSYINMYSNAVVSTSGAALGIGDSWWYRAAPYVTVNLYNNAQFSSLGGAGLWMGGHLNIYDTATFLVNGYVNFEYNIGTLSDGTRSLVMGGGTLLLPEGFNTSVNNGTSGTVYDWIQRGILRAYGKGQDTNDLTISDNGTNIVVTTVPLGGDLQHVYFEPLLKPSVAVGVFQQVALAGDYPAVTGVLLSSSEPGLDPATFPHPVYTSSNPDVATIDSNGLLTAISPGTATLTATVGVLTSTNSVSLTVTRATPTALVHRYSFNETGGTNTADSIGGAAWAGTLNGGATLGGGQLTLDGTNGYVRLPAGLVSGLDEVTIEAWASFGSPINTWACLYAFGSWDSTTGYGENYLTFQPHTGGGTASANFGQGDPGNSGETDIATSGTLDGMTNVQVVAVMHPFAGYEALYTNGVLVGTAPIFNDLIDPVAYATPASTNAVNSFVATTFNGGSVVDLTLGPDLTNYVGHSLYYTDPYLNGSIDELRIYNGPLTAAQIAADNALGPNQVIGTVTNVSLAVTLTAGNVAITWPATSALVNLVSSPVLGPGAVWTPAAGALAVAGGSYQMTVPMSGSARYFRLEN